MLVRDQPKTVAFGKTLHTLRTTTGQTQATLAHTIGVSISTIRVWEQGKHSPKFWRLPEIARGLGVPVAALFDTPGGDRTVAEVVVSRATLGEISKHGHPAAQEAADRLARALEPILYTAATGRTPRPGGGRARPRRTREQVLAGIQAANTARARVAQELKQAAGEASIEAEG